MEGNWDDVPSLTLRTPRPYHRAMKPSQPIKGLLFKVLVFFAVLGTAASANAGKKRLSRVRPARPALYVNPGLGHRMPKKSYLAVRYLDHRRKYESWVVYYEDGRQESYDGRKWWLDCKLGRKAIAEIKAAIRKSGITRARNFGRGLAKGTATLVYFWRLGRRGGKLTNSAYPAREHPEVKRLEKALDAITRKTCPKRLHKPGRGPHIGRGGPYGYMRVNTKPWTRIYVDGRYKGTTPKLRIKLRAGRHRICLKSKPRNINFCKIITIRPGKILTFVRRFP